VSSRSTDAAGRILASKLEAKEQGVKRKNLTERDRAERFGVSPLAWTTYECDRQEANAQKRMGQ
jgi:hypothetical protein